MQNTENISVLVAFAAGLLAFLSPCVLPLIPSYISYLTGISFRELEGGALSGQRKKEITLLTIIHALSFIFGFSIIFVLLGTTATFLGTLLLNHQAILRKVSGAMIIFFALFIMGFIKVPFLQKEARLSYRRGGVSALGSMLIGAAFGVAWTPCVGPILGSILIYASSTASMKTGVKLLTAFSFGLGLPFFISALAVNSFLAYTKKIQQYIRWIELATGSVLIIFGIILLSGRSLM